MFVFFLAKEALLLHSLDGPGMRFGCHERKITDRRNEYGYSVQFLTKCV